MPQLNGHATVLAGFDNKIDVPVHRNHPALEVKFIAQPETKAFGKAQNQQRRLDERKFVPSHPIGLRPRFRHRLVGQGALHPKVKITRTRPDGWVNPIALETARAL